MPDLLFERGTKIERNENMNLIIYDANIRYVKEHLRVKLDSSNPSRHKRRHYSFMWLLYLFYFYLGAQIVRLNPFWSGSHIKVEIAVYAYVVNVGF